VTGSALNGGLFGVVGLDEHATGTNGAPGSACDLGQKLKRAFSGAKIGQTHAGVRKNNTDEGDAGKIVPLGQHLGADQDVGLSSVHGRQHADQTARRVAIEAFDFRLGKQHRHALGTFSRWSQ
jgi:hypothetical protein